MLWNRVSLTVEQDSERGKTRLETVELPDAAMYEASACNILSSDLGFRKSMERNICMLGDERVIPMMSYGLIEYMMALDLSGFDLLELGGGHSTEFWSQRTRSVLTLEQDPQWLRVLKSRKFPNAEIRATTAQSVAGDVRKLGQVFHAIVIDNSANRYACAKAALTLLKPGGFILLDNSDWYPNTAALLRQADLIQVDFNDFRPRHFFRCATSLFLHKDFRARPRYDRLPQPVIGGKDIELVNELDSISD